MSENSGNGSLLVGGGVTGMAILTLILQNSGKLGDFSTVLSGPGGVALLAVAAVIASVAFTYRGMVVPARQETARVVADREKVRIDLTQAFAARQKALEEEMVKMRDAILKLTEENARHKALLEALGGTVAVGTTNQD